jgi:hypothetical protein
MMRRALCQVLEGSGTWSHIPNLGMLLALGRKAIPREGSKYLDFVRTKTEQVMGFLLRG